MLLLLLHAAIFEYCNVQAAVYLIGEVRESSPRAEGRPKVDTARIACVGECGTTFFYVLISKPLSGNPSDCMSIFRVTDTMMNTHILRVV